MDKLLFLFHRKDGLTREEFFEHYLDVHAPLGMRLTVTMDGYTVNLVDTDTEGDAAPDAVTEIWTESWADFFDPGKSFATPDDAQELMADHDSFIGPYDTYLVEERVVRGSGAAPDGVKRIACYVEGDAVPLRGVFIRAPWIEEAGPDVEILAEHDGHPVLARQGRILVAAFHPELTDDTRVHERFLHVVEEVAHVRA